MMNKFAPIILFVYNRPKHTKKVIESLAKNELSKKSELWIFSDNAKNEDNLLRVKEVREYIDSIEEKNIFKKVIIVKSDYNKGLANSVIDGVGRVINKYKKAIVIEDDLIFSKNFLNYMNEALEFYEKDKRIWSISGYNIPIDISKKYEKDVYLGYRGCSWGWATWSDRWNSVDWNVESYNEFKYNKIARKKFNRGGPDMSQMLDCQMNGLIDSWAIRWCYEQSNQDKFTVYPVESLVRNIGLDGSGTHSKKCDKYNVHLSSKDIVLSSNLEIDNDIVMKFYNHFSRGPVQKILELLTIIRLDKFVSYIKRKAKKK